MYRSRDGVSYIVDHRGRVVAEALWMQHTQACVPGLVGLPLTVQHQPVIELQVLGSHQTPHLRQHGQLEERRRENKHA